MPAESPESSLSHLLEETEKVQVEQLDLATYLTPTKIYRLDFEEDSRHLFKQAAPHRGDSICDVCEFVDV